MDLDKRESHDAAGWDEELWKNAMDDSDPDYYWSFINQENKVINVFCLVHTYEHVVVGTRHKHKPD